MIVAHQEGGQTCVQVFFFRGGQNWGNRAYFPSHDRQLAVADVLKVCLSGQFYDNRSKPPLVLLSHELGASSGWSRRRCRLAAGASALAVPRARGRTSGKLVEAGEGGRRP